jgi:membrane-associated phospholipid phosphatase
MNMSPKRITFFGVAIALGGLYYALNPFRVEHIAIACVFLGLWGLSERTRSLAFALLPVALFVYFYDLLRFFAPRSYETVVVEPVYRIEAWLFGWIGGTVGEFAGPVAVFREHHNLILDLAGGVWYATHVPAFMLYLGFLWWRSGGENGGDARKHLAVVGWGFLIMNVVGMSFHVLVPTAPPWYIEQYGMAPPGEPISGSPAALARVDAFINYPYFTRIYSKGSYVFGAVPSMHAAISLWIALVIREDWLKPFGWIFAAGMSFFAVYLGHHYIIDVLAGWLVAYLTYLPSFSNRGRQFIRAVDREIRSVMTGATVVK